MNYKAENKDTMKFFLDNSKRNNKRSNLGLCSERSIKDYFLGVKSK